MNLLANSGLETRDTPFINVVIQTAQKISQLFDHAVDGKRISLGDLFDTEYIPISGTNPQQYTTRFTEFTDQVLPPIQEPQLHFSPLVVFCVAVDRNGYAPTHNQKYSLPQRSSPVWNNSNCRNRRMFNLGAGLRAAQNLKPFLLQTYRREMGGSKFTMMKDVSAPIFVNGKHWGALRMGYVIE